MRETLDLIRMMREIQRSGVFASGIFWSEIGEQRQGQLARTCCQQCGGLLLGDDPAPARHQVSEIPRCKPELTEYRRHTLTCLARGATNHAAWPTEMPQGSFGPRVQATVAFLTGRIGASHRDVVEVMQTVHGLEVSLGSVPAIQQQVSAALERPVQATQDYIQHQAVNNVDETSWREGEQQHWLWVNATAQATLFKLLPGRGTAEAKRVIGEAYAGIAGTDRYGAYTWLGERRRQICWAHLKREWQAFVERGGASEQVGQQLLEQTTELFKLWHQLREGRLNWPDFQAAMKPIQGRVGALLRAGTTVDHAKTQGTCRQILKLEAALWTFVKVAGVEPTNNAAERALRRAVLWRCRSLGTKSATGSRFVERIADGGHQLAPAGSGCARLLDCRVCFSERHYAPLLFAAGLILTHLHAQSPTPFINIGGDHDSKLDGQAPSWSTLACPQIAPARRHT